jgi:prephenate dehydrogenase
MDEPGFAHGSRLAAAHVAILGLGLMGGSLALGLRGRCAGLIGVDPDPLARRLALESGAFEQVFATPEGALAGADLVLLATPVGAILGLLKDLARLLPHPREVVVLDLGSTKSEIVAAMQSLPPGFDPLGGHPMAGKEKNTFAAAEATLFNGRAFAFTYLERTSPHACALAAELASVLGAQPLWLDAGIHDRWVAATSHLPYLAACALASAVPPETAPMAGPGLNSSTRLASTPPSVMLDVLLSNRANLLGALGEFKNCLEALESALRSQDAPALEQLLATAGERRGSLFAGGMR